MKIISIILSLYLLASVALPCTQQVAQFDNTTASCCSDTSTETNHKLPADNHSDNDCSGCNPLASCHCCSVMFTTITHTQATVSARVSSTKSHYSTPFLSITIFQIWHPPKTA